MKKLFIYMSVLAVTLTFAACGSKGPKFEMGDAPELVEQFALVLHTAFQEEQEEGLTYEGIEVIKKDIIVTITIDESKMQGMTLTQAMRAHGINPTDFQENTKKEIISLIKSDPEFALHSSTLRCYRYNVVIRYQGSESKENLDVVIDHDLWNHPYLFQ